MAYRSELLHCGFCGVFFKTWRDYAACGHDEGYGECKSCKKIHEKNFQERVDDILEILYKIGYKELVTRIKKADRESQIRYALWAIEEGYVGFNIRK